MRIADKMAFNQVNSNISKNRTEMSSLQNQAATQKRVTKPSDDPVAASRVLFSRTEQRGNEQFIKNLNYARSFLDFSDQTLSDVSEIIMRAKELAISQANDAGSNELTKNAVAAEVRQLHNQLVQVANRKLGERYIFGGFKTTAPPFGEQGNYKGDDGELKLHINKDSFLPMNMPGSAIFLGEGITRDGVTRVSIPQPKTVEDLQDVQDLEVEQQNQKVHLEAGSQTETEQTVLESDSDVAQRGPASLRQPVGATEVNSVTIVDEKATAKYESGVNIFKSLADLDVSLRVNDKYGVQESIEILDDALQQVILARTTLGSRVTSIDKELDSLHTIGVNTKNSISQLEDADVFQVISDMNKTESTLQATLNTSGKLIQKSLMDFVS